MIATERGTIGDDRIRTLSEFRELFFWHVALASGVFYPSSIHYQLLCKRVPRLDLLLQTPRFHPRISDNTASGSRAYRWTIWDISL